MIQTPCGKEKSRNGKSFTVDTLADHIKNCHNSVCKMVCKAEEEFNYDPLGILGDDMPDGAYFAMHQEIYGW